jgi:hypothetical protein
VIIVISDRRSEMNQKLEIHQLHPGRHLTDIRLNRYLIGMMLGTSYSSIMV